MDCPAEVVELYCRCTAEDPSQRPTARDILGVVLAAGGEGGGMVRESAQDSEPTDHAKLGHCGLGASEATGAGARAAPTSAVRRLGQFMHEAQTSACGEGHAGGGSGADNGSAAVLGDHAGGAGAPPGEARGDTADGRSEGLPCEDESLNGWDDSSPPHARWAESAATVAGHAERGGASMSGGRLVPQQGEGADAEEALAVAWAVMARGAAAQGLHS